MHFLLGNYSEDGCRSWTFVKFIWVPNLNLSTLAKKFNMDVYLVSKLDSAENENNKSALVLRQVILDNVEHWVTVKHTFLFLAVSA